MGAFSAYHPTVRPVRRDSIIDQTAEHLREGIRAGRWRGELPGVLRLAAECDVSKDAMRAALHFLETEGLRSAGHAGGRRTVLAEGGLAPARAVRAKSGTLRVAILLYDPLEKESTIMRQTLRDLQNDLEAAGHVAAFAPKTQAELHFDPARIAKLVAATPADAWVVASAPREVLDFFGGSRSPPSRSAAASSMRGLRAPASMGRPRSAPRHAGSSRSGTAASC